MKKKVVLLVCAIFIFAVIAIFFRMKYDISNTYTINEKGSYDYEVIIRQYHGKVIFSEEYYHVQPFIEVIGKDMITLGVSGGLNCWVTRFINVKEGDISEKFVGIVAYNFDKVAYPAYIDGGMKIIVQDIFDKSKYYFEIIRDYAPTAVGNDMIIDARFLDEATLYLEYYRGEEWEEVIEIIKL